VTSYTYTNDIRRSLNSDCTSCHSPDQHEAGYDFTTYAGVRRALTPGNPQSIILREIEPGAATRIVSRKHDANAFQDVGV
jgi:hypothetical protein